MSVVQTSEYRAIRGGAHECFPYMVADVAQRGGAVDWYRTRSGAEYAARLLNGGLATVNAHALTGCRVEAK